MVDHVKRTDPTVDYTKQDDPLTFTKADGDKGELEGYASIFYKVDSYGEFTVPGAFAKSIAERGPKAARNRIHFRYEHEHTVGKHLDMVEDDKGLAISAFVSDDGMWGSTLRTHLKDGLQYGISIGYRALRWRAGTPDDPLDITDAPSWLFDQNGEFDPAQAVGLTETKLKENSAVSFPAVDTALVNAYRSDAGISALDQLLKDCRDGRLTDAQITSLKRTSEDLLAALASHSAKADAPGYADSDVLLLIAEIEFELAGKGLARC
jgi:HK97 family phage prohead protease